MFEILIIDNSAIGSKEIADSAKNTGMNISLHTATELNFALKLIEKCEINVIIINSHVNRFSGIDILKNIKNFVKKTPIIYISDDEKEIAEANNLGVFYHIILKLYYNEISRKSDYITKKLGLFFTQINSIIIENYLNSKCKKDENKNSMIYKNIINKSKIQKIDLILIASSTGGPSALETLFLNINTKISKPILIVQHMSQHFTKKFAETLDKLGSIRCVEGNEDLIIKKNLAIVAPGGFHMVVKEKDNYIRCVSINSDPMVNYVRPSADVLFKSVSEVYKGANILTIVLTGMGSDGMNGVRELKENCNCYCIVQNEKSSVVFGMPKVVYEAGLADEIMDIKDIGKRVMQIADDGG